MEFQPMALKLSSTGSQVIFTLLRAVQEFHYMHFTNCWFCNKWILGGLYNTPFLDITFPQKANASLKLTGLFWNSWTVPNQFLILFPPNESFRRCFSLKLCFPDRKAFCFASPSTSKILPFSNTSGSRRDNTLEVLVVLVQPGLPNKNCVVPAKLSHWQ